MSFPNSMRRMMNKLVALLGRRQFRDGLEEEMAFHRQQAERAFVAEGLSPDEARYAAMRQFGNATRVREQNHEAVEFSFESVAQDVRYALRQLAANPGFTAIITLTLALSIGANSAIFSVIQGVLLKPLPYPHAEKLVRLFLTSPEYPKFPLNPNDFRDFRFRNKSFQSMAAFTRADTQLSGAGEPAELAGFGITAGYFRVLGLKPQLGREFDFNNEIVGNGDQAIISDRLWRTRFHADPAILGQKITLDMQPYTVIGVMPANTEHPGNDYHSVPYGESVDVWRPFHFNGNTNQRGSHFIEGIARLRDGVSAEQASAEMNAIMAQLGREHPGDGGWHVLVIPLYREVVGAQQRMLFVLLGAVSMVLLIACANAANLLLARAASRQREVAVRLALGAPRLRIIRQMLTESLLIALLGGGLGAALAEGGVKGLVSLLPADFPRAHDIHVNGYVFAFTFLVSIFTGVLFGLAPALQASRMDPKRGLYEGGRSATGSARQQRLRSVLVVSEVSLACVLLIGAGLMLRSFLNQLHLDPGFSKDHVLTATLALPRAVYKNDAAVAHFYDRLLTDLAHVPGVTSAGAGSDLPWTGFDENAGGFTIEGKTPPPHEEFHGRFHVATPQYFLALGTPLVRGRFFKESDNADAPSVLIINQAMASRYWPGEDVVGRRLTFADNPKDKDWMTIVGVVGDVKDRPDSLAAEPAFWWPFSQNPNGFGVNGLSLVLRTAGDPRQLADALRNEVNRLDPSLPVAEVRPMDEVADQSIATPRLAFSLIGLFAGVAIVLAAIGTYGVVSYSVSQRIPEFGLRLALGAPPADLLRMVLIQAGRLALAGAVIGLIVALILARVLRSLVYNVSPADPLTFVSVLSIVVFIALLACYLPARRAARANPMVALRAD
jgi:predicted permease